MLHVPTDHQPLLEQTPSSGDAVFDNCCVQSVVVLTPLYVLVPKQVPVTPCKCSVTSCRGLMSHHTRAQSSYSRCMQPFCEIPPLTSTISESQKHIAQKHVVYGSRKLSFQDVITVKMQDFSTREGIDTFRLISLFISGKADNYVLLWFQQKNK